MYLRKMRIIIHINFTTVSVYFQYGLLHKKSGGKLWDFNNSYFLLDKYAESDIINM